MSKKINEMKGHDRIELKSELEGTILENVDKKLLSYGVTEDYFESLSEKVLEDINQAPTHVYGKRISLSVWIGIAASFLMLMGYMMCFHSTSSPEINIFQSADTETLIQYATNDLEFEDISIEDIYELDEAPDFTGIDLEEVDSYIENHTDITELEEMIEYL